MISLEEARSLLLDGVVPLAAEQVPLRSCGERVLAADVLATIDQPAEPRSAMDGYAVRSADAVSGAKLRVVGEAFAGAPFSGPLQAGTAVRIATGGVVPPGADRVIMQEACRGDGSTVTLVGPLAEARFVRPAASDFARGDLLLSEGQVLGPAQLAVSAASGHAVLPVRRRARVAIFASGDELREPGEALGPGETYNSASAAIDQLVQRWGAIPVRQATLPDDLAAAAEAIATAREAADVLLFIGGASVGERDLLRSAVGQLGAMLRFDRIAVQPGKPSWHARFPGGQAVLGLPGNPVSAFVCAHLLLEPLIAAFSGRPSHTHFMAAKLTAPLPMGGGRECYWRGSALVSGDGQLAVTPDTRSDSSLQRALANSNALIQRAADAPAAATGTLVRIALTGPLGP